MRWLTGCLLKAPRQLDGRLRSLSQCLLTCPSGSRPRNSSACSRGVRPQWRRAVAGALQALPLANPASDPPR